MTKSRTLLPETLDFNCKIGQTDSDTTTFTNTGDEIIVISNIQVSGEGFEVSHSNMPIVLKPSDAEVITVTYKPKNIRKITGSLSITSTYSSSLDTVVLNGSAIATMGFYDIVANHTKDYVGLEEEGFFLHGQANFGTYDNVGSGSDLSYDIETATFVADPVGDYVVSNVTTRPLSDVNLDVEAKLKTVDYIDDNDIKKR